MRNALTIFRRELIASLQNPGVYVVAGLFFFLLSSVSLNGVYEYADRSTTGAARGESAQDFTQTVVVGTFGAVSVLFIFVIPIVTMRAFAEERRSGMFELLATWPIRDWELILGKFMGIAAVLLIIDAFLVFYVIAFYTLIPPDPGVVACCALGVVLVTLAYASFGLFASSLTENQIVAAIVTFSGLFLFWIAHTFAGESTTVYSRLCEELSLYKHYANFSRGAFSFSDVAYFVLFTLFWLFMTARKLETRRWKV